MKHYLIDSENVGDFWIPLLELPADQAELIVFYTKNSPHMSYDSLIKLKESDRTVTFIKCYEGTNALDFQLCSELGFLIAQNEGDDFIIVTNDTGYDAAVKYWRHKEYSVKRIAGKDSRTGSRRRGTPARYDVAAEVNAILHKLARTADIAEDGEETVSDFPDIEDMSAAQETGDTAMESDYEEEDMDEEPAQYGEEDGNEIEAAQEDDLEEEPADEDDQEQESEYEEEYDEDAGSDSGTYSDDTEDADAEEQDDTDEVPAESETEEEGSPVSDEADTAENDAACTESETGEQDSVETALKEADETEEAALEDPDSEAAGFAPDLEEITAIVNCIGMDNLAELHNQLIQFYGDNGKDIYQSIKSGTLTIEKQDWDKEEKFLYYCALILRHSDEPEEALQEESITEFARFLLGAENKRKNLNSLRYALIKHYGQEKGRRYYFMLKPYVKALNQM